MKHIHKFLQLSRSEKFLLLQGLWVLALATLGLKIIPWLKLQSLLVNSARQHTKWRSNDPPQPRQITRAIRIASRCIPRATCLPQALTAQHLLIRYAYPADFQIGVAKDKQGRLEAHAWVNSSGQTIIGGVPGWQRFVPLSSKEGRAIDVRAF